MSGTDLHSSDHPVPDGGTDPLSGRIRPIALVAVRRGGDLLVFEARDEVKRETFYRPLGGGIEFGETAAAAILREMREELAAELVNVRLLGVLENIFHAFGRPGHEIVFVFAAELADRSLYERDDLGRVIDDDCLASWQPLARFTAGEAPLYPHGLLGLLSTSTPGPPRHSS